jgi:Terpene synthase family 2, C-terminal metal binding
VNRQNGDPAPVAYDNLLPADVTVDVSLKALRLIGLLDTWGSNYREPFTPEHSTVYCLASAFSAPWLSVDVLHLATKIWTWITAIDDAADKFYEDYDALCVSADRCRDVLNGEHPDPNDQLAVVLAEIRDGLARYPLFGDLAPLWRDTVDRLIAAMKFERRAADSWLAGGPPPALAEYLEQGSQTIGIPMYMVSLWSTMDEVELPTYVPELLPPLRESALAVRLGNDLRSYSREKLDGNLNALMLGTTPQQLVQAIRAHVENSRRQLQPLTHLGSAIALNRLTTWSTRLYDKIDFRTPGIWSEDSTEAHRTTNSV